MLEFNSKHHDELKNRWQIGELRLHRKLIRRSTKSGVINLPQKVMLMRQASYHKNYHNKVHVSMAAKLHNTWQLYSISISIWAGAADPLQVNSIVTSWCGHAYNEWKPATTARHHFDWTFEEITSRLHIKHQGLIGPQTSQQMPPRV